MNSKAQNTPLDECVDAIESAYEYFLAYAAQGRQSDRGGAGATSEVRKHLQAMVDSMAQLSGVIRQRIEQKSPDLLNNAAAFVDAIEQDAAKAAGALQLALAQTDISSQLIDNLNASIHVRALLTDLFIVDEALREPASK